MHLQENTLFDLRPQRYYIRCKVKVTRNVAQYPLHHVTCSSPKSVSMIRKYHNPKLQTNPWHCEKGPHNNRKTKFAVRSKVVVLLLLTFCLLLLPLWESVIVLCFVVRYFLSILVLQSS